MKIGIIADIHSNIYGLKKVLKKLKKTDLILCAGDITGYYSFVNEVFDEIRRENVQCILGNHDAYILDIISSPMNNPIVEKSIDYTKKVITEKNLSYLRDVKEPELDTVIDNLRIKMYHGSPWDKFEEYVYPDYQYFEKFKEVSADLVILGHTHRPMIKKTGEVIIMNPGSCGQPRDKSPEPSYAIFNTITKKINIRENVYNLNEIY